MRSVKSGGLTLEQLADREYRGAWDVRLAREIDSAAANHRALSKGPDNGK